MKDDNIALPVLYQQPWRSRGFYLETYEPSIQVLDPAFHYEQRPPHTLTDHSAK